MAPGVGVWKALQKQVYNILSSKAGLLITFSCTCLVIFSAFQFGETVVEWSRDKYAAVFNSFSDNLKGRSLQNRLCSAVPIDVVYTWVNGTDPKLLLELKKIKAQLETQVNATENKKKKKDGDDDDKKACMFAHCVPALTLVLQPDLGQSVSLKIIRRLSPALANATRAHWLGSPDPGGLNATAVVFETRPEVQAALNATILFNGKNFTQREAFYTSDWTVPRSISVPQVLVASGLPDMKDKTILLDQLPTAIQSAVSHTEYHKDQNIAVLHVSEKSAVDYLKEVTNITVAGKKPTFQTANLVWNIVEGFGDIAEANRFEDNEELRYSLRSVEKFAPWVRHVYIVTNGQIPYWLDMDNPRVTLVTHKELFPNASHLPTFSSPAIESHLHRIPGLSRRFLYLNDDVMFGKEVWPEDFYTHSNGQKIYLTWPVPSCRDGCPSTWIKDGYCDKPCNNSDCDWDGGDCDGKHPGGGQYWGGGGAGAGYWKDWQSAYCATGCANNWVADKYCDNACNTAACGYDAGDCGVGKFGELASVSAHRGTHGYTLERGEQVAYMNLSRVFPEGSRITEAAHDPSQAVRVAAVSNKFKTLTVLLMPGKNASTVPFNLTGVSDANITYQFMFNLTVDTSVNKTTTTTTTITVTSTVAPVNNSVEDPQPVVTAFSLATFAPEDREPKARYGRGEAETIEKTNISAVYNVSEELSEALANLQASLDGGELTEKGFYLRQQDLWLEYVQELKDQGKTPATLPPTTPKPKVNNVNETQTESKVDESDAQVAAKVDESDTQRKTKSESSPKARPKNRSPSPESLLKGGGRVTMRITEGPGDGGKAAQRHLLSLEGSFLPWESKGPLSKLLLERERKERAAQFETPVHHSRAVLDTFGESLRHVNRLYNAAFGVTSRKVPAHIPHFIDSVIMGELQDRFPEQWARTSSHRVRSPDDMQFAFSYYYFLMSQTVNFTAPVVFAKLDADHSGVLSDRELRVLATKIYTLPLYLQTLDGFERLLANCSRNYTTDHSLVTPSTKEEYYNNDMPQVTLDFFLNCSSLQQLVTKHFGKLQKYPYEEKDDSEVMFKMVRTNASHTIGHLDEIRKKPKKFICLNDNIDHSNPEAATVKAVLYDFYESLFPTQSQFEIPLGYGNRFQYIEEYEEWLYQRNVLRYATYGMLTLLILYSIYSFIMDRIEANTNHTGSRQDV